jgi:2-dehydro-3-deoxygluconokinase
VSAPPGAVACFGETMVRLSAEAGEALETARSVAVHVAGSESNVAVGLARLGLTARWISALPDNALGRLIAGELRRAGVDLSALRWTSRGRVGLYFTELATGEWMREVVYDRDGSAFAAAEPDDFAWTTLDGCRLLHVSGITPALRPNGAALFERAIGEAHGRRVGVSLDVNFRSSLWPARKARAWMRRHLENVEVLFVSQRDLAVVVDDSAPRTAARRLAGDFGMSAVVVTVGRDGAIASVDGRLYDAPAHDVEVVDRIGRGDAFVAGWLAGYLGGGAPDEWLRLGCALAAVAQTYRGDMVWGDGALFRRVARGEGLGLER